MDVLHTPQSGGVQVRWTLREKDAATGRYADVRSARNTFTDAGITNLAMNWMGQGVQTLYLIIDSYAALVQNNPAAAGSTSVSLDTQPTKAGDTQLVLGVGLSSQETVTFTTISGTGPFLYTLSTPTVNVHNQNEWAVRPVKQADLLADIKTEVQYDSVAAPGKRMKASGNGLSPGTGQYTMQFFLTGSQALVNWVTLGLSATDTVGAGSLYNHLLFGYTHTSGNDVELDITLTLANA